MRLFPSLPSLSSLSSRSLLVVLVVAASGCSSPDDGLECPDLNTLARVDSIDGTTVHVQLLQSSQGHGPATLHTAGAEFHYYAGSSDECYESKRELLAPGQEIEVFVDAWMESFPPQAHVDDVVIRG